MLQPFVIVKKRMPLKCLCLQVFQRFDKF